MGILALLYGIGCIAGVLFAIVLILAPLKLYEITDELKKLNETMETHTRLLAEVANAASKELERH